MDPIPDPKTYLITGATSGIGLSLVEQLLEKGHRVIGVSRSPERCAARETQLQETYSASRIRYLPADLSRRREIDEIPFRVEEQLKEWQAVGLDGLVNNAGTFTFWQSFTPEGFETQWAVNHLAPYQLTLQLLPLLEQGQGGKVLTISSGSHYRSRLNWDDLQLFERYNPLKAYQRSKLAAVMFMAELRKQLGPDSSLQTAAVDPGLVNTGMGSKTGSQLAARIWSYRKKRGITPQKSASGILQLLLEIELDEQSPIYWKHGEPQRPNPFALDPNHNHRLWKITAQMTGINI